MNAKKAARKAVPTPPPADQKVEEVPSPTVRRRPWYIALLAVGTVLLAGSIVLAITGVWDAWERQIFAVVNHVSLPDWAAEQVAKPFSNAVWGMAGLVLLLLAFPKYRLLAWQYAVAGGAAYAVVFVLEHAIDRARPILLEGYDVVMRASQGGPGFPSGHVAVLTALGLTIWPMVSWPWRLLILAFVAIEAWARVFLGVHAPLDVVGGIAVGMTVVAIIHLTPAKIRKIFKIGA